jgi:geranylgeranyl diphosphate synthase type II
LKSGFSNGSELLNEFTIMATQVCEGQQMDMNLPTQEKISETEYLQMIRLKTAVLPACALKMGAMAAGADAEQSDHYYDFGLNLGMAFQLQDDYLDAFGSSKETGKIEGGDILENKRTLLYLHACENLERDDREELLNWYNERVHDKEMKVRRVRELFRNSGSDSYILSLKKEFEKHAMDNIHKACGDSKHIDQVLGLFEMLKDRKT